jgi:hypothetical protein
MPGPLQPPYTTSELLSSTGSAAVTRVIKKWLATCAMHRACQASTESLFAPLRLEHVGKHGQSKYRLVERSNLDGQHLQYFRLSHCEGHNVKVVLTTENLD